MVVYKIGSYDILRAENLRKLDKEIQKSKEKGADIFALGIYDDNLCEALGLDKPLKSLEDRMKIMEQIRGIDFVFPVSSLDEEIMEAKVKEYYELYTQKIKNNKVQNEKQFNIGYAPGTYDLFHAGHLENLMIAANSCEKLIVGVKADELVEQHKHRKPVLDETERMEILRHFKFVYDVYPYYTRDLHVADSWISSKYKEKVGAVFLGSDLREDFKDSPDINIVFTERNPDKMKERSTTAYIGKLKTLSIGKAESGKKYTGNIKGQVMKQKANNNDNNRDSRENKGNKENDDELELG